MLCAIAGVEIDGHNNSMLKKPPFFWCQPHFQLSMLACERSIIYKVLRIVMTNMGLVTRKMTRMAMVGIFYFFLFCIILKIYHNSAIYFKI